MEHARHPDVSDVAERAKNFGCDVSARHRGADDGVAVGILESADAFHVETKPLARYFQQIVQVGPSDQVGVRHRLRRVVLDAHDSALSFELVDRRAEPACRELQKQCSCGCGDVTQRLRALRDRRAPPDAALIGRRRRVAEHERDAIHRDVQLLRHHLGEGGLDAHPDFGFAAEDPNGSVLVDLEPRVQPRRRREPGVFERRGKKLRRDGEVEDAEADQEASSVLDELSSRQCGIRSHSYALLFMSLAARRTAAKIRT